MMNSNQLTTVATKLMGERAFLGVFALERIPTNLYQHKLPVHFIVNTQTSNLPGQHWLGVSILSNGQVYIFDPLGQSPPQALVRQLQRQRGVHRITYNKHQYQSFLSTQCGQHVLSYLSAQL